MVSGVNAAGDDMAVLRSAAKRPGGLLEVLAANKAHGADGSAAPSVLDSSTLKKDLRLDELRQRVEATLRAQGFRVQGGRILAPHSDDKVRIRQLHLPAVEVQREQARTALAAKEPRLLSWLAAGAAVNPARIDPVLLEVRKGTLESAVWRWCALHWSVPVSRGYGRRLRFLVLDAGHDSKVIGLIGLGDPVYALRARDSWIGWSAEQRNQRLVSVMDAFALGAVPPYAQLLGGKLVALLATSDEVRTAFRRKYGHRQTLITDRDPDAHLVLVTTTSALGRSSIFNRLRHQDGSPAFWPIGYTSGSGDFHLSGPIYEELAALAADHYSSTARHERWGGDGFRNRREVLQRALAVLGFDSEALRVHGVRRQVLVAPLAENARELLRSEQPLPLWPTRPVADLAGWWRQRWALPRAARDGTYRAFDPATWRLWPTG